MDIIMASPDLQIAPPHASTTTIIILLLLQLTTSFTSAKNHAPTMQVHLSFDDGTGVVEAPEDTPVNSLIGVMQVKDEDEGHEGKTVCTANSEYVDLKLMNKDMYKISLMKHLDREKEERFMVSLMCSDMGDPRLSRSMTFSIVVNDVNDNPPKFSNKIYKTEIPENEIDSTKLNVKLDVIDWDSDDNGIFEYTLEDSNGEKSELFEIDPKKGDIYTLAPLDREEMQEIRLIIRAIDFGIPPLSSSAEVIVSVLDLNDNHPSIVTESLHVLEGLPALSTVGMVTGIDADSGVNGEITFSMAEDQDGEMIPPFLIRPDGTVLAAVPLDRELLDVYTINVKATDRGSPPLSNVSAVTIYVDDANDNVPIIIRPREESSDFSDENSSSVLSINWYCPEHNRIVYQAHAIDEDEGENARVTYSIAHINDIETGSDSLFEIDPDSGKIDLKRCVRSSDSPVQIIHLVFRDNGDPGLESHATLNVTLDVDFSSLTTPPPTTPKPSAAFTEPSSSSSLAASILLTFALAAYLSLNVCHEFFYR